MVEMLLAFTVGVLGGLGLAKKVFQRKIFIVEDYKIEPIEKEGFTKLIVTVKDQNDTTLPLEFHPNHAHAFSDDLVRKSAQARRPKEVSHG